MGGWNGNGSPEGLAPNFLQVSDPRTSEWSNQEGQTVVRRFVDPYPKWITIELLKLGGMSIKNIIINDIQNIGQVIFDFILTIKSQI